MINKLVNLIKRVVTSAAMQDSGNYPIVQVQYLGRTAFVELLSPYGLSTSPPIGSLGTCWSILGQEDNRAALITAGAARFKNLQPGEVVVGNYLTQSYVKFNVDGSISIVAAGNLTATVGGTTTLNSTGNVNITAPQVIINGTLQVTGDIIDNSGSNTDTMAGMRTKYNSHTHSGVQTGSGNTGTTSLPM